MHCRLARWVSDGQRTSASLMIARPNAPVAQLERVAASEAAGRWFESSRARQILLLSIPVRWVTVYTGDMGDCFAAKGFSALSIRHVYCR